MAIEKIIDLQIQSNADQAEKSVGNLKSQLRAAQLEVATLSEKFGATSREAVIAAKKAGELKDKIGDAKALTDAFNPDAKFKALTSSLSGVAGGFGALQGGMALFGAESEDVAKTLLKVQSAMALSQGLQSVGESIDSFKQLGAVINSSTGFQKINTIVTAAAAMVQKLFTGAVNTTATSFNALKTAIVSTGIGALVVGIGYLISKMNESADATEQLTIKQKSLNNQLEITKKLTDDTAKSIDYNTQIQLANAKKRGASEKELLRIQLDAYEAKGKANNKEIEDIQRTQKDTLSLTKEQNKRIQDLREDNQNLQRQGNVAIANLDADLFKKQRDNNEDHNEKVKEKNKTASTKAQQDKIEQQKKDAEDLKNALDAQKNTELTAREEITKEIGDAQDKQAEANLTASEIEQRVVKDKYFGLIELAKQQNRSKEEIDVLETQRKNELKLIDDKFKLEDDAKKAAELEKTIADKETSYEDKLIAIDAEQALYQKQFDDKLITEADFTTKTNALSTSRKELQKIEHEEHLKQMGQLANALDGLAKLAGEKTAAGKALAIAAATINTYKGISEVWGAKSIGNPIVDMAVKIASTAIVAAQGIANVSKIMSVKVPGGGGGGGSVPTASTATAPQFNVVGASGANQIAQSIGGQEQQPIKAYVTAGDVTTGQSLNRNIISNASMG